MFKYNHPTLGWLLDYWPSVVFVPTILLVIAVLALVTHWWDKRDESVRERQQSVPLTQRPASAGTGASPVTPPAVGAFEAAGWAAMARR